MNAQPGLLLFAHGARDPNWAVPFEDVARRVRVQRPGMPVALAFLEFMAPDIVTAGNTLVAAGCTSVAVVPLFLGAGGHVRKDLPERLGRLRAAHPAVQWTLQPAAGESPRLVEALAQVALDCLEEHAQ